MAGELRYWRDVLDAAPVEWKRIPLKEVFRERKDTGREDLPLLAVTGDQGIIPRDELDRRDTSSADKSKYLRVVPGDLAYNTMRMWQGVSGISAYEGIVSPAYTVCELRDSHNPDFMSYLCKMPLLVARFHAYSQGIVSDTLSLRFQQFGEIVAPIPPATEQRKIAAILSSVDDAIAATRKVIEQTKRVKQGLLQRLMTRGLGHTRFKKTEVGEIPENWKIRRLDEVARVQTGVAKNSRQKGVVRELPYLRVANVQDGHLDLREVKTIKVPEAKIARYLLRPGDVLVTEGGDYDKLGRGHIWHGQIDPCVHQNHVFVIRPDRDVLIPEFLNALTSSPYGKRYFLSCAKQTTNLASINSTQLRSFPVLLPPPQEQRAIVKRIEGVDECLNRYESERDCLEAVKRGLMQDLLTGRVRVQPD